MPYKINGQPFNPDAPFTTENGTQYPANWFRQASQKEREALGIVEYPDLPKPSEIYYWITEYPDGTFTATEKDINQFKPTLIKQAWDIFQQKFYSSIITVQTSVGPYKFECNQDTIENINSINTMISRNLPVPNPRSYTPKGETSPVNLTHDDFGLIGLELAMNKDKYFQAYATHKTIITNLTQENFQTLISYDVTKNWPDSENISDAKIQKINELTAEKNNLINQLQNPADPAEIIYTEMLETYLENLITEINTFTTQEELNSLTIQWPVFGA